MTTLLCRALFLFLFDSKFVDLSCFLSFLCSFTVFIRRFFACVRVSVIVRVRHSAVDAVENRLAKDGGIE